MADILRYGAYLPRYRAPLKEIQSFYGRPGRPRSKALCTPALDEDTLTMAYEASVAGGIPVILEVLPAVLESAAAAGLRVVTLRHALS